MDYYRDVVLADERRFLVSEARMHMKVVEPGQVRGERKVVIQDGKCVIDVAEDVWRVWREYEGRGKDEEQKECENGEAHAENDGAP